ncbi:MAG: alpha/beta hydrolase family protein [Steroidobacteraceae bacterium]
MRTESRVIACLLWTLAVGPPSSAAAESTLSGDLPRRENRVLEAIPGLDSHFDLLRTADGARLRTILTRPAGSTGRLSAILFVQWLSCDSIELPEKQQDGWSRMLRRLAQESGMVMMRTEKAGVGDSEGGACERLDYETELSHHRAALAALRRSEHVDAARIVVFGASMGGNMAPLVAAGEPLAGVMIWGGGAHSWFERMLGFERRAKELSAIPAAELDAYMRSLQRFLLAYLLERKDPATIAREQPALAGIWGRIVGTGEGSHYGRPLAFHQQAAQQDWAAAWERVDAPVLALYGEYDWFEDVAAHRLVAEIANRRASGRGELVQIAGTDHHFERFADARAAFRGEGGVVNSDAAVDVMLRWLHVQVLRGGGSPPSQSP